MKTHFKRSVWLVGLVAVLVIGAFWSGVYLGYSNQPAVLKIIGVSAKDNTTHQDTADFAPFWKAWSLLDERFVDTSASGTASSVTDQDKVWGAISGLTSSLGDPYTVFMPPVKKTQFEQDVNGNFGGVGMEVGIKDGVATVISPLPDSPAKKAGILAGDKIVKVGATSTASMNIDQVINFIRGPKGTKVTVTLVRAKVEQPIVVTLTRDTIVIPTVETKKYPDGVFSISLFNFSAQSPALFRNALQEFVDSGDTKLILDLRGNPGGYLEAAVDIASWFLPAKAVIVREAKGKGLPENVYVSKGYNIFQKLGRPIKMEILVDQGSASAAEILAGALAQNGVGEMVGQKTFGKGSVQELVPVTPETSLKITVAKWLTPDGTSISHNGLMPKYVVNLTIDDVKAGRDPQKDKAIQLLTK